MSGDRRAQVRVTTAVAVTAVAAAAVLLALTVAVLVHPGPLPGELAIVGRLQRLGEPVPSFARFVRATTSTEACLVASLPAATWVVRRHGWRAAPAIVIVLLATLAVQPLMKDVVDRPRPTAEQVDVRAHHESESFPSGHSLSTTATWGAASLYAWRARRRDVAALLAAPVALTGVASSIQGVHWPSDAIAGTIVGAGAAWLAVRAIPERSR